MRTAEHLFNLALLDVCFIALLGLSPLMIGFIPVSSMLLITCSITWLGLRAAGTVR